MFNPLMQQTVKETVQYLPANFAVVELGNQTFVGEEYTAKSYYEAQGASSYVALDVNKRLDALICDLNYAVVNQLGFTDPVDLVTNNGTSEHLFNQAQVFNNIHDLCAKDGIMLHVLPLFVWLNHGFYNYNPIFFRDLSRANDYKILSYKIANRWGEGETINNFDELFKEKNPNELFEVIKRIYTVAPLHNDVFNVVCLKKTNNDEFKFPMQGKYLKDVEANIPST